MVSLSRLNAKTDRRHERRALPEKELQALLSSAGGSKVEFLGLTGNDRMMVYALAILTAAGLPYRDADGRVADFHALRHSYITLLERSGVSPKLAQELARHSDIRLTMNVYTHVRLHDLAGAVDGLPALLPSAAADGPMKATETDSVCAPVCTGFAQTTDSESYHLRLVEALKDGGGRKGTGPNPLMSQEVEAG